MKETTRWNKRKKNSWDQRGVGVARKEGQEILRGNKQCKQRWETRKCEEKKQRKGMKRGVEAVKEIGRGKETKQEAGVKKT